MASRQNKKDIQNFLTVLFAGVLAAVLLVVWMVGGEPGEKRPSVAKTLLSPQTIEAISNRSVSANPTYSAQYLVESIDFSYFDEETSKWTLVEVDIAPYKAFYQLIENDEGLTAPKEGTIELFQDPRIATLAIYVKAHKPYATGSQVELFQQVQFLANSDWYRVQIHTDSTSPEWAYYQHADIQAQAIKLLKR